jgi:transposase InsO family protein
VLDQCSRRVLGWRLGAIRDSRLTRAVVAAALRRRQLPAGLIVHSDRGSEFLGTVFRSYLAAHGVRHSMTGGGAPAENAHMESFFHSLKADVIHGRSFQTARSSAESFVAICRTTTISAWIPRWTINRPLTTSALQRRTSRVYRIEGRSRRMGRGAPRLSC